MHYKLRLGAFFACLLFISSITLAQTIHNPIIADNIADASVVYFNGTYYLYGTSDIDHGLKQMGPPVVWKSTDLQNWSYSGTLFSGIDFSKPYSYTDSKGAARTGYFRYWAPGKVMLKNKQYYLYATIVKPDEQVGTYLLIADKPEGPYRFSNGTGIYFNQPEKAAEEAKPVAPDIDGAPFVDDDGHAYLFWRRRQAAALSNDWKALNGAPVTIATKRAGYSEGPFMFKRNGVYYYLYTLSGNANYCYAYMMSTAGPLGPFTAPQNDIILKSDITKGVWGPGHGNVLQIPGTDDFVFFYLEYSLGGTTRQVFANSLKFNADGTIIPVGVDRAGIPAIAKPDTKQLVAVKPAQVSASSYRNDTLIKTGVDTAIDRLMNIGGRLNGPDVVAVQRAISFKPECAIDGLNDTRWMAAAGDAAPWYQIDLGEAKNVNRVECYFVNSTLGHTYRLERSLDGKNWQTVETQVSLLIQSPAVINKIGKARYLKISILSGAAGIWELKVY